MMGHEEAMMAAERTRWIRDRARAVGFDLCGVAPVDALEELVHLPEWLVRGYAGEMNYLGDPRRADPRRVLEGARSLIVLALNYNTQRPYSTETPLTSGDEPPRGWISRYAWGDDYHQVLGEKLDMLLRAMRAEFAESFEARAYVDTGPMVERVAAKYAGLGWLAKNTCLINEQLGSWLFLGVIVTTLALEQTLEPGELPAPDLCGNCRLCLDACPTEAFPEPYVLDARRCISYLTIEHRGPIEPDLQPGMAGWQFGCDVCQDVCPWNRKAPATRHPEFVPETSFPGAEAVRAMDDATIRRELQGTALLRAKPAGIRRNALIYLDNEV
jgi:epoxyqueuosine reductase